MKIRVKIEVARTRHQDRGKTNTLVVEAAVSGVGHKHGHPILTFRAYNTNDGVVSRQCLTPDGAKDAEEEEHKNHFLPSLVVMMMGKFL